MRKLRELKLDGYCPDIIILQWTQIVLLVSKIKSLFPNSKVISIEEDVVFLGFQRKMELETSQKPRNYWRRRFDKLKELEIQALNKSDLVVFNNKKDQALAEREGHKTKSFVWSPFFQSMISNKREKPNHDILFYGAMSRPENWKSAIWFIQNVMPLLDDLDIRFIIAGNRPDKELRKYESERVVLLGFVEDISQVFTNSMCLVAPLVLGAGVKIKIIEGISAGIPVLTNSIGIEGIPAIDEKDYFFCEKPEEYASIIRKLYHHEIDVDAIDKNCREFILQHYNYEQDAEKFYSIIASL